MCVDSRGRDSPHREQSKIDAVVPQLQCEYGYMRGGGPLQIARASSWSRHLFWSHPRYDDTRLQQYGHALRGCCNPQVRA